MDPETVTLSVSPVLGLGDEINEIRSKTAELVSKLIIPNENLLQADVSNSQSLRQEIITNVKEAKLWAPHLPKEYGGMGIGFLGHAYMNEVLAWSQLSNPLFGVVAPDSGNQKILIKYGTEEQKKQWHIMISIFFTPN